MDGRTKEELQVLNYLGIDNFRQLTKDHAIKILSDLKDMDPELAKAVIAQFPEYAGVLKTVATEWTNAYNKSLESNDKSQESVVEIRKQVISRIQVELDNPDLSFDEKKELLAKMSQEADKVQEADKENKKFIAGIFKTILTGGTFLACTGLCLLGGKFIFNKAD